MATDPTQQFYEAHAGEYEKKTMDLQSRLFTGLFIETLPKKARVLDVGCAVGRDSLTFVQQGYAVTGVDYSHALLDRARSLVPGGTFLYQDMRFLDFPPASFEGIWAFMSLLHLKKSEVPAVLQLFHTILVPDGLLALGLKMGEGEGLESDKRYGGAQKYFAYFSETEVRDLLTHAGFTVVSLAIADPQPPYQDRALLEVLARRISAD